VVRNIVSNGLNLMGEGTEGLCVPRLHHFDWLWSRSGTKFFPYDQRLEGKVPLYMVHRVFGTSVA